MSVVRQDMRPVRSDPQACQAVGGERAGIDVDPVVAQLGLPDGRVAVHDDEAELAVVLQELSESTPSTRACESLCLTRFNAFFNSLRHCGTAKRSRRTRSDRLGPGNGA